MSHVTTSRFQSGDRVEHIASAIHGTVQTDNGEDVVVCWDDGMTGILQRSHSVVFNAFRLLKLRTMDPAQ